MCHSSASPRLAVFWHGDYKIPESAMDYRDDSKTKNIGRTLLLNNFFFINYSSIPNFLAK
jgi:hypothetical protein